MTKKRKHSESFKSVLGEDLSLEERRLKYGYYNNRLETFEESGSERK